MRGVEPLIQDRGRVRRSALRVAIVAVALLCAAPALAQTPAAAATDRTVPVAKGSRLTIANDAGEVVIKAWNQDSLRVRASHSDRSAVDIQTAANVISIRSRRGQSHISIDYEISAPAWLPIKVTGQFAYIAVEGAQSEVTAETIRGDIVIRGAAGPVTAKSIHGEIIIEDSRGRITATTVNEDIRIAGASGEIVAETTNGNITLETIGAGTVDVSTVNGDVRVGSSLPAGARVRVETHNGDITMIVPETAGATFTVRTYRGDLQSNLPTKVVEEPRRGRRAVYTLGNGGADVELQSFGGTIRLRRPGTVPALRDRGRGKQHEHPPEDSPLPPGDVSGTLLSGSEQSPDRGRR
jgi:DUF4097 and DUF4098 domain-containing protein YvlB